METTAQDTKPETILQTIGLTKRFYTVLANDRIDLSVFGGEIHCLLGENGAGKSTLAECLYGYYQPDGGQVVFKGNPVLFSSPKDAIQLGIAMVHQRFSLVEPLSTIENVLLVEQEKGVFLDQPRAEQRFKSLCETYGVDLEPRTPVWQLSVGEQQWVEILKALYVGVELLILDEPTAVLTPQETDRLFEVLQVMKKQGLSIIFITHKLAEVMNVSDRVTVLRKGRRIATVNTADVTKTELARMMVGREVVFQVERVETPIGEPVLEIKDLRAQDDAGQEALRGIDLTLHKGEILGLAGVAGNGQKELFEVLVGMRQARGGGVLVESQDVTNCSPTQIMEKGIAYVPDDRIGQGLIMSFSVAENLILGQQRSRQYNKGMFLDGERIQKFAQECASSFEIVTPSLDHLTKYLSGGNMQKVILARELWRHPRVLLANQPTRGLDVGVIEYVHRRLLEKKREQVGILLASEDLEELFNLSDRIAVMFKGQIMGIFAVKDASIVEIGLLMAGIRSGS